MHASLSGPCPRRLWNRVTPLVGGGLCLDASRITASLRDGVQHTGNVPGDSGADLGLELVEVVDSDQVVHTPFITLITAPLDATPSSTTGAGARSRGHASHSVDRRRRQPRTRSARSRRFR